MLDFQLAAADETTGHRKVTNVTFAAAVEPGYHRPGSFDAVDHEEIATELASSARDEGIGSCEAAEKSS